MRLTYRTWSFPGDSIVVVAMSDRHLLLSLLMEENEEEEIIIELVRKKNTEIHPIIQKRQEEGFFNILVNGHLLQDDAKFLDFFRLNIAQFNFVCDLIRDQIQTDSSNRYPYPITPEGKLAITLRFMATGESFHSLQFAFRIPYSYISRIVEATLSALEQKLKLLFLPLLTEEDLKVKAEEFQQRWQFPNCVGAIDGKHVRVFCPSKSGLLFFNCKTFFSIVLLAVVDANYRFIFIDVGSYGKEGDSGIFDKSELGKKFSKCALFPPPRKLPNSDIVLPHVFVGDKAFRLHPNMMKVYSRPEATTDNTKANFNYRLSSARRVSENAFALQSQVFRVFRLKGLPHLLEEVVLRTRMGSLFEICSQNISTVVQDKSNGKVTMSLERSRLVPLVRSQFVCLLSKFLICVLFRTFIKIEKVLPINE